MGCDHLLSFQAHAKAQEAASTQTELQQLQEQLSLNAEAIRLKEEEMKLFSLEVWKPFPFFSHLNPLR